MMETKSPILRLNLDSNIIDDACMPLLAELIAKSKCIDAVLIGGNNITDDGIESLCDTLIGNNAFKALGLHGNKAITDYSAALILDIVNGSHLTEINLSGTSISSEKQKEIRNALLIPVSQREIPIMSKAKSAAKGMR